MDLTTKERVKALRGITDTLSDDLIDLVIANVSARFESVLGRHVLDTDYTETYELAKAGKVVWLRGYPVDAITSIVYSQRPNDTSASALTVNDDYYLDSEAGMVRLNLTTTPYNPGYLKVTYGGGMATTTALFIGEWPDITAACDTQTVHELNRRRTPGSDIETRDGKSSFGSPEVNLLSGVREVLIAHSRTVL